MLIDGIRTLIFYMPLFVLTMKFGMSLWFRLYVPSTLHRGDQSHEPTVTVLLPVYNEGEHVLDTINSILACDYPVDKLRVVAVDDCSADDSYAWVKKAEAQSDGRVAAFRNAVNSGKHRSLSFALQHADSDIVICIDSDCIFERDVVRRMTSHFVDPAIGAVGGSIGISNVNDNVVTSAQAMVYWMSFQVGKMLENYFRRVMCISGCLFAVRRHIFQEIEEIIANRSWMGLSIRDGEDRYMTHEILMRGWLTIIDPDVQAWTKAPTTLSDLFRQQVRWRRSGLRDFFWTLNRLWSHIRIFGTFGLFIVLVPEGFMIAWSFVLLGTVFMAPSIQSFATSAAAFGAAYVVAGLAYNAWMARRGWHDRIITRTWLLPMVGLWHITDAVFTTAIALFTFDSGAWGTREVKPTSNQHSI